MWAYLAEFYLTDASGVLLDQRAAEVCMMLRRKLPLVGWGFINLLACCLL